MNLYNPDPELELKILGVIEEHKKAYKKPPLFSTVAERVGISTDGLISAGVSMYKRGLIDFVADSLPSQTDDIVGPYCQLDITHKGISYPVKLYFNSVKERYPEIARRLGIGLKEALINAGAKKEGIGCNLDLGGGFNLAVDFSTDEPYNIGLCAQGLCIPSLEILRPQLPAIKNTMDEFLQNLEKNQT